MQYNTEQHHSSATMLQPNNAVELQCLSARRTQRQGSSPPHYPAPTTTQATGGSSAEMWRLGPLSTLMRIRQDRQWQQKNKQDTGDA